MTGHPAPLPRPPAWTGPRDRGAGTVLVVGLVATTLVLLMATAALVRAERARSTAQAAADLAALAAATQLVHVAAGPAAACRTAADVAARNGATMTRCRVEAGGVVQVRTARPAGVGAATGRARAGPVAVRARNP